MSDSSACRILSWIVQILTWISLIIAIITNSMNDIDNDSKLTCLVIFVIIYLVYLLTEFCSETASYLCHKNTEGGIYQKMGKLYKTYPVIEFYCECYHYENRKVHTTYTDKNGKKRHQTRTERVRKTTYTERYYMPYYSERDVSGLFYLDCDRALVQKKIYIQLDIYDEINFADPISYMDYEFEKDRFWRRNRFRDIYFDFKESRYIPGLTRNNLIKLVNSEPWYVNFFCFFIITLLTFAEIYTIIFNSLCVKQRYTIRKLVSTRYDLNQPIYSQFTPRIDLINMQLNYGGDYYNYINNDYDLKLPTEEELKMAEQYKNKVPDYKLSSGGGQIHAGVIIDNPGYSSYDLNVPPPAFASYGGDVAIDQNHINENGKLPPGFGQPGFQGNNDNTMSPILQNNGQGYQSNNQLPLNQPQGYDPNNPGFYPPPQNPGNSERQGFQPPQGN